MEGDDDMQLNFDDPLAMLQRQIERRIARPKVPLTKVTAAGLEPGIHTETQEPF
jgi:hypothetical protein